MIERLLLFFAKYPIDFTAYISSILPIVVGVVRYRYLTPALKIIWLLFIISFIKDTYSLVLIFTVANNLHIQNIESIYQTVLIGLIFYFLFDSAFNRRLIVAFTCIGLLITLLSYRSTEISSVSLSTFRVFSIGLVLAYYGKVLMDMRIKNMATYSLFWFTAGLLIYAAGTFFIVLLSQYWYQSINKVPMPVFDKYWNITQFLLILFTVLSAIGLWFSNRDRENLS